MTPQKKMQAALAQAGIPHKEIKCYGAQIMVTCWSRSAAAKWASLLSNFATVRGVVESRDYTKDPSEVVKHNPGLVKTAVTHPVWLVGATIK